MKRGPVLTEEYPQWVKRKRSISFPLGPFNIMCDDMGSTGRARQLHAEARLSQVEHRTAEFREEPALSMDTICTRRED